MLNKIICVNQQCMYFEFARVRRELSKTERAANTNGAREYAWVRLSTPVQITRVFLHRVRPEYARIRLDTPECASTKYT